MSKPNHTNYRTNGAIGALLDEYEKAINELISIIKDVPDHHLSILADPDTKDEECRSIQSILTHVASSGFTYAIYCRKYCGDVLEFKRIGLLDSSDKYIDALREMFLFTETVFSDYPLIPLEENAESKKIHVRWGQQYDVEQLMEHAIVHILRHRRQIERFLLKEVFQN